jgi:hypothetical protein
LAIELACFPSAKLEFYEAFAWLVNAPPRPASHPAAAHRVVAETRGNAGKKSPRRVRLTWPLIDESGILSRSFGGLNILGGKE